MNAYNNYRLYRTNPLLSGQMKWNIVLKNDSTNLVVDKLEFSTINPSIKSVNKEVNYAEGHLFNIKSYYTLNATNFYDTSIDPQFESEEPITKIDNTPLKLYSNTYDMGCKRVPYSKYNKQYEYFCPLWLEKIGNNDKLVFTIKVLSLKGDTIGSRSLILDLKDTDTPFNEYFSNYIKDTGINIGCGNILNLEFKKPSNYYNGLVQIEGIDVTSAKCYAIGKDVLTINKKNVSNASTVLNSLTSKEQPMVNFNSCITNLFKDNNMICKQLLNFSFYFDLEDIISKQVIDMMSYATFKIEVDVNLFEYKELYSNNKPLYAESVALEKTDFYTEYDFIPRQSVIENKNVNVLDYLRDNKYIYNINKYKFDNNICYWKHNYTDDIIFNVYDGFAGLLGIDADGNNIYNKHYYGLTPNLDAYILTETNQIGWIKYVEIDSFNLFYSRYIKKADYYKTHGTLIDVNTSFINSIKYSIPAGSDEYPKIVDNINNKYILGVVVKDANLLNNIVRIITTNTNYTCINLYKNNTYGIILNDAGLVIILTSKKSNLVFKFFRDYILNSFVHSVESSSSNAVFIALHYILKRVIEPSLILFNSVLQPISINGPINMEKPHKEIDSMTVLNSALAQNKYVLRYDGLIKPLFSNKPCTIYYKDYITIAAYEQGRFRDTIYNNYSYSKLYPSIDFCGIKKLSNWEWNYDNIPKVSITGDYENKANTDVSIYDNSVEYSWFNDNRILCIPKSTVLHIEDEENTEINELIIKTLMTTHSLNEVTAIYIKSLYNTSIAYTIDNMGDTTKYIYTVTLTLK